MRGATTVERCPLYRASIRHVEQQVEGWAPGKLDTDAWRHYFQAVARDDKFVAVSMRRVARALIEAKERDLCLYCWMPQPACMCAEVPDLSDSLGGAVAPVMLFHAEEFLRRSNSGHIAAMLLNAPIVVEGIPSHDAIIRSLPHLHPSQYFTSADPATAPPPVHTTLLFPAPDAAKVDVAVAAAQGERGRVLVLALLDGTWNQGNSLHHRLPKAIPRSIVDIPSDYVSLFAPIREQTRSSGVSTLEATVLALHQVLRAQQGEEAATALSSSCVDTMKTFVDMVRLQKHMSIVYPDVSGKFIREIAGAVHTYSLDRHQQAEAAAVAKLRETADGDDVEGQLPPWARYAPVANMCYCCESMVGWSRMEAHVAGKRHRECWEQRGRTWEPSAQTATIARWTSRKEEAPTSGDATSSS